MYIVARKAMGELYTNFVLPVPDLDFNGETTKTLYKWSEVSEKQKQWTRFETPDMIEEIWIAACTASAMRNRQKEWK